MATKEPSTGIAFSSTLKAPGGGNTDLSFVGCGLREKKIAFIKVKIYVVGLYVDASRLGGSPLKSWKGKSGSDLTNDDAFFKALQEFPAEKAVKLVLARDMEGAEFWTRALEEPLGSRLKTAGSSGQQALTSLGNVFKSRSLKQGSSIVFTWSQPATLHVAVAAPNATATAPDATINSAALLAALFDLFLGKDAAAPPLKASIASTFPSLA